MFCEKARSCYFSCKTTLKRKQQQLEYCCHGLMKTRALQWKTRWEGQLQLEERGD